MEKRLRAIESSCARALVIVSCFAALAIGSEVADAAEYNQRPFLGAGQNAKVQRAISGGRSVVGQQNGAGNNVINPNKTVVNTDCGKLSVGGVKTTGKPGERLPRENITVVKEVINAPTNCGVRSRTR